MTSKGTEIVQGLMNVKDPKKQLGFPPSFDESADRELYRKKIALSLASHGVPLNSKEDEQLANLASDLIRNYREKVRLQSSALPPVGQRIQAFIDKHLADTEVPIKLPTDTFVLASHGIARELSFPVGKDKFESEYVTSYRLLQGVLHNPRSDKRTTQGSFHIAEGGLPVPADKYSVPKPVFARMLKAALCPPAKLNTIPYTSGTPHEVSIMTSLYMRPLVCPAIPGKSPVRSLEVYAMTPGNLVGCLDFLESIFANAGDPSLPENDAALDVQGWTGHTGFLLLAPHVAKIPKKDLGLPHWDNATPLQREQGMCWKDPSEPYNSGRAFKCTCRTLDGVVITIIADNYFGYCKKEVKSEISYACNLMGIAEEEHAGGTLAFPRYNYGLTVDMPQQARCFSRMAGYTFDEAMRILGPVADIKPEGYAVDKNYPKDLVYVPENAYFSLLTNTVSWKKGDTEHSIKLVPHKYYMTPNGFKVQLERHPAAPAWRLIGTDGNGTFLHKPCTVSGGGKSELSKRIDGAMMYGPLFVGDVETDFAKIDEILFKDYSGRFPAGYDESDGEEDSATGKKARSFLSPKRTIGSVIKLLTPNPSYSPEYNAWLKGIPAHVMAIVFFIKSQYKPEWGTDWRSKFSLDLINGTSGHELKYEKRKVLEGLLRVGYLSGNMWKTFKCRPDFVPCSKIQMEDDISASATIPPTWIPSYLPPSTSPATMTTHRHESQSVPSLLQTPKAPRSYKLVTNCEFRLFQRPDDCIYRGEDAQTEYDLAQPGNFIANFEPLRTPDIRNIVEDVTNFEAFTQPMRDFLTKAAAEQPDDKYIVSSAHTRLVNGKPTANPRYLQLRPDAVDSCSTYVGEMGIRLYNRVSHDSPVVVPVDLTMLGRRISKPAPNLPNLSVYNPIHYQELPEMFMDLICSVSGTSPSTTGAGSEGALTKGPFNSMPMTGDLDNLFISCALTGLGGWSTPTGYIGPKCMYAHDISFICPEVWCRMRTYERDPAWLIRNGYLEPVKDFDYQGRKVQASRLGYRITEKFADFFGRVFDFPHIFDPTVLRPELQDMQSFVDGVDSVLTAQKVIAQRYFDDGTVELATPPIKALLHIMVHGDFNGKKIDDPEIRGMFTRDSILGSKWYHERLVELQKRDRATWEKHVANLTAYIANPLNAEPSTKLDLAKRLKFAQAKLAEINAPGFVESLVGTIGADLFRPFP